MNGGIEVLHTCMKYSSTKKCQFEWKANDTKEHRYQGTERDTKDENRNK